MSIIYDNKQPKALYYGSQRIGIAYVGSDLIWVHDDQITAGLVDGSISTYVVPAGVTSIGDYAFSDCSLLKSIVIPAGVTSIEDFAFNDCHSLTDIFCGFAAGAVDGAPWGADNATIHYNSTGPEV